MTRFIVLYTAAICAVGATFGMDWALTAGCVALPVLGGMLGMRRGK